MEHVYLLLSYMKPTTLAHMYDDISELAFTNEAGRLATAIRQQLIALVGKDEANTMITDLALRDHIARIKAQREADEALVRADWYAPLGAGQSAPNAVFGNLEDMEQSEAAADAYNTRPRNASQ